MAINSYHRFNLLLMPAIALGVVGIGVFNTAVNPYGILPSPEVQRLNALKPSQFNNVRLFKAVDIKRLQPQSVILGSSRADLGIDPTHPAIQQAGKAYNLGIVGPNMYEVRRYFDHAIANQPDLKQVVLGLDFFMFSENLENAPDFNERRLGRTTIEPKDLFRSLFSVNALDSSLTTLEANLRADAEYLYRPDGMRYVYGDRLNGPLDNRFPGMTARLTQLYYDDFELSEKHLADFQAIVDTCEERGIELKIFISPEHATALAALQESGRWQEFEDWKRQIVAIAPVWDFSGFNTVTTEPISETMVNYWDSSHYTKAVGDLILNRIFDYETASVPSDFGVLLSEENLEAHLIQVRSQKLAWLQEHPLTRQVSYQQN
ncbi:MAG: hypothetical protein VKK04_11400 [Synechococcales bacterium]|nr:hypothetical protein [Synechococcales bacterium]